MLRLEDGPEFDSPDIHVPGTRNTNFSFSSFVHAPCRETCSYCCTGQPSRRRAAALVMPFPHLKNNRVDAAKPARGIPVRLAISGRARAAERISRGLQILYGSNCCARGSQK